MTTTKDKDRLRITRPGSGVAVEPRRVMAMRQRRLLTRKQVSERIAALGLADEHGKPVTMGRDHLGKIETGWRQPSLDAMRALCTALECTTDELMPGGPVITIPVTAKARQSRLAHNRELRAFAVKYGLRYKNPRTGRVYYSKPLRKAYAAQVAVTMAAEGAGPGALALEDAQAEAAAALDAAVAALRLPGEDSPEERLVS
jgi:transcriptional regulator with XRE-family HTH domain